MDSLTVQTDEFSEIDHQSLEYVTKYSSDWIGVKSLDNKGRGIVALRDIPVGTVIERCPVLIIPAKDRIKTDKTIVFTYVYMWEHGTTEQDLYNASGRAAVALGLSSLLNHSYSPNANFIRHIDELELELRSCRDISAGEEITIDYQMKLWFDPA
jgi:SET domain-containing protein